jgi:pescadillo protein
MGKMKKKGSCGSATTYISRNRAVKKLHISLKDFRQLCILKGIYPQDPATRKGHKPTDTLYFYKDIQYLSHEPVIETYRNFRICMRKIKKYKDKRDEGAVSRWKGNLPTYKLDHIVKERYPTFVDAIRDLDDCLSMCFLYSTFPKSNMNHETLTLLSRRLTIEFLQYVIESRSLEKVFISIKGYYYQAEVMGQRITWVVPHTYGYQRPDQVDFKIMRTFVEFYLTLLGFVNFRLYNSINAVYPPQLNLTSCGAGGEEDTDYALAEQMVSETVSALNQRLLRTSSDGAEEEPEVDEFLLADSGTGLKEAKDAEEKAKKFKKMFEGFKFYINREVPREAFVFVIRCFGGEVSWDKTVYIGATFDKDDSSITHELVDRPKVEQMFANRYYIQPQWVFDCINARMLLPVEDYFPGAILPPHLSPFVIEREGDYIPPERKAQIYRQMGIDPALAAAEKSSGDEDEGMEEGGSDQESVKEGQQTPHKLSAGAEKRRNRWKNKKGKKEMAVVPGQLVAENPLEQQKEEAKEEKKLAELMIPKRKQYFYNLLLRREKEKKREVNKMKAKRESFEKAQKKKKKAKVSE